jgi:transketolase
MPGGQMAVSDQTVVTGMQLDQLCINTIRTLSMDAVQKANSGHPGTPMALAPAAYCLWQQFLRYDPEDPIWPNRDRFVLSNGHASMLLYSLLHLAGVRSVNPKYERLGDPAVSLEDIKNFRQLNSKTPGHPEYRLTSGVETTTGPLGQGAANSVGMALAGHWLGEHFNRPGFELFNFNVWVFCGDGDLMEGVSSEAASIAGHLKLANLCWIYDNNRITIEGKTDLAFSEDVAARFRAYGWDTTHVHDANDLGQLAGAYQHALGIKDRPKLIVLDSHIGFGAPNRQDTKEAHGEPLGEEEVKLAKRFYGWPEDAKFLVPDGVRENFRGGIGQRGHQLRQQWSSLYKKYSEEYQDLALQLDRMSRRQLPDGWDKDLPTFPPDPKGTATRESSSKVLNAIAKNHPWLMGGSADLYPSTKTRLTFEGAGDFEAGHYNARNFHFGIREHAMGAIVNGRALAKMRAYRADGNSHDLDLHA